MKNTVLKKVLTLFLLCEIPLAIISYIAIKTVSHQLENKIISSLEESSSRFSESLNSGISETYISNTLLKSQGNINNLAAYSGGFSAYRRAETIKTIIEQLNNLVITNPYLSHANIYFKNSMRVYHTADQRGGNFHTFDQDCWERLSSMAQHPETLHDYYHPFLQKDSLVMLVAPSTAAPQFIIEFILSADYIQTLAKQQNQVYETLYCVSMCGNAIAANMDEELLSAIQSEDIQTKPAPDTPVFTGGKQYYCFHYELPYCDGAYTELVPAADILPYPLKITANFMIIFFVVLTGCSILFFTAIFHLIHKPLTKLTDGFKAVENGCFDHLIEDSAENEFSYLYRAFNRMSSRLSSLIQQNYESKLLMQKAELKQLQAQINPHFLYNSFFLLQNMSKSGMIEESQKMMELLAVYFRYITKNSMDYTTLKEEYNHAKVYAEIQMLRFKGRIQIQIDDIPEACKAIPVPKLILQPIIENAFQHGIKNKLHDGIIALHFHTVPDFVSISIEDNSDILSDEALTKLQKALSDVSVGTFQHEMSGLLNIHRRLTIYSQCNGQIEVSRSVMGGLKVCVILEKKNLIR